MAKFKIQFNWEKACFHQLQSTQIGCCKSRLTSFNELDCAISVQHSYAKICFQHQPQRHKCLNSLMVDDFGRIA